MVIGDEEQDLLRLGEEVARFTDADLGMDMGMGMREEDEEDEHMQGMGDDDDQGSEGEEEDEDEEVDDEDAITDDEAVFEVCLSDDCISTTAGSWVRQWMLILDTTTF